MLVISFVVSGLVVFVANVIARKSASLLPVWPIAGISIFCVVFPAVALNGILLLLTLLLCLFTKGGPRLFLKCSLGAVLLSHILVGILSFSPIREDLALREAYPSESLADRLAYEKQGLHHRLDASRAANPVTPQNAPKAIADEGLTEIEKRIDHSTSMRTFMLRFLHKRAVEDFVDSPGFGISRRIRPRREDIELPEAEPIPLPATGASADYVHGSPSPSPSEGSQQTSADSALRDMHFDSVVDFVNPKGFGLVEDREHVTGFQPHQFRGMPRLSGTAAENHRWHIQSLELVSLLTHEEPVVYESKHLPRMDELKNARTRPLAAFERHALAALEGGEDLNTETTANHIRMLGSIRALKQCTACHAVERGELLGAFSYTLRRDPPLQ